MWHMCQLNKMYKNDMCQLNKMYNNDICVNSIQFLQNNGICHLKINIQWPQLTKKCKL